MNRSDIGEGALEARVRELEDMAEIQHLVLDYGRYLDSKDFAACSKLFAREGVFVLPFESVVGPDAIQASMEGMLGKHLGAEPGVDFHVLANLIIHLDGDTARSTSFWLYVSPREDGHPQLAQFGHYEDELVREDGRWRFKSRDASRDIGFPQAGVPGAVPE
jgi:ketosteroid isomerase-like protein